MPSNKKPLPGITRTNRSTTGGVLPQNLKARVDLPDPVRCCPLLFLPSREKERQKGEEQSM